MSELEDDDDGEGQRDHRPDLEAADVEQRQPRQVDQPGRQLVGGDHLAAERFDQDAAIDRQRAERDDDRRHPAPGDQHAVDRAHAAPMRDRDRDGQRRGDMSG